MSKPIVCFDFDGVLAYHETDWPIDRIGKPLREGFERARAEQAAGNRLVVLTSRPAWLHAKIQRFVAKHGKKYGVYFDRTTNVKPPALRYYDDRAERVPKNWRPSAIELLSRARHEAVCYETPARVAVTYYYDQRPVAGKQEIKLPVRFMSKQQRIRLLVCAGVELVAEIDRLLSEGGK
jgi:hypothetical protein